MKINYVAQSKLPTPWGDFSVIGFEEVNTNRNHLALTYGNIKGEEPILSRIHSECLTGDALFSLRCDCGAQLKSALIQISKEGKGVLLYHRQEGRNIGLLNKIRAYSLQDDGDDTVEANRKLGFSADERDFTICADIFKFLNINKIRLLTNNPRKIKSLEESGIYVSERIPLLVGRNEKNKQYLETKKKKMGHIF